MDSVPPWRPAPLSFYRIQAATGNQWWSWRRGRGLHRRIWEAFWIHCSSLVAVAGSPVNTSRYTQCNGSFTDPFFKHHRFPHSPPNNNFPTRSLFNLKPRMQLWHRHSRHIWRNQNQAPLFIPANKHWTSPWEELVTVGDFQVPNTQQPLQEVNSVMCSSDD